MQKAARTIQPRRDADPQHVPIPDAWMVRLCCHCICGRCHRSRFQIISTPYTHVEIPGNELVGSPTEWGSNGAYLSRTLKHTVHPGLLPPSLWMSPANPDLASDLEFPRSETTATAVAAASAPARRGRWDWRPHLAPVRCVVPPHIRAPKHGRRHTGLPSLLPRPLWTKLLADSRRMQKAASPLLEESAVWQARSLQPQRDADPQHVPLDGSTLPLLRLPPLPPGRLRDNARRYPRRWARRQPEQRCDPWTLGHISDPAGSRNSSAGVASPDTAGSGTSEHMGPPTIHVNVRRRSLSSFAATAHVIGGYTRAHWSQAYSFPEEGQARA